MVSKYVLKLPRSRATRGLLHFIIIIFVVVYVVFKKEVSRVATLLVSVVLTINNTTVELKYLP